MESSFSPSNGAVVIAAIESSYSQGAVDISSNNITISVTNAVKNRVVIN